ncbi:MAG: hypothetical protein JKX69_04255, partial [Rhodobacteraceae bacterium]|nr:hypothetical protein [Paracoccaceae bacterium]
MDIQSRITRLPIAYEPELGAEAAGYVPGASGQLAALLAGAGGCSPFLAGLIRKEAAWLETALEAPESAAAAEL